MAAVRAIEAAEKDGRLEIVTSRVSWGEQDRTQDASLRSQFQIDRTNVAVVTNDHRLVGFQRLEDHTGGYIVNPLVTDIPDEPLFRALKAVGLKDDVDARHLLYAICNGCDRFVTTDAHFLGRKGELESLSHDLVISKPSDLAAELLKAVAGWG
jgi:hypothetical protein